MNIRLLSEQNIRSVEGFETLPEADISSALGEAYLTIARGLYAQIHDPVARPGIANFAKSSICPATNACISYIMKT